VGEGRILAIDPGDRRVGLAVSDPLGITAQGLPTLDRSASLRRDLDRIAAIARQHRATRFLVGLPVNMDGTEGPQAGKARAFGAMLAERSGLPVAFLDERLTSREAERVLRIEGVDVRRDAGTVDRLAATILLQSYLDSCTPGGRP
jgi:putative Holliday junction resolvase